MIGKFTTENQQEAIDNPDLVYLSKQFFKDIRAIGNMRPKQINRCGYCRCLLTQYEKRIKHVPKYCSTWCLQQDKYYDAVKRKEELQKKS